MAKTKTSGEQLLDDVFTLSNAGAGLIHVRAKEVARAFKELRDGITVKGFECSTWNVVTGDYKMTTKDIESISLRTGDNNPDFLGHLGNLFKNTIDDDAEFHTYHVYVNVERWFDEPAIEYLIQQLARDLPSTYHRVIFVSADKPLPDNVSDLMVSASMSTPTYPELETIYNNLLEGLPKTYTDLLDIKEDGLERICRAGSGLTFEEFETYLSEAFVRSAAGNTENGSVDHNDILSYLNKSKADVINKSGLLELYSTEDMSNVGGFDIAKDWVLKRKNCYSEEAREQGIEPPKGILLTGIPGAGKTLFASTVASTLGVPMLRLDIGKMFNSYVGATESRLRAALTMIEELGSCVVLIDEIEKSLGASGGSDGGTSQRVMGTFLTWLNDNTSDAFIVASANDVTRMPPELTRKGRLDQIFFVGLPNAAEKRDILNIHLNKRGYGEVFDDSDIELLVEHLNGFVGAEIEAVVKEALVTMFSDGSDLKADHIMQAARAIVPLSTSHASVVKDIITWGSQNAISASSPLSDTAKKRRVRRQRNVSSIH